MSNRKYIGKALGDTEYALEQWGLWRMSGMGVPRYSSPMYILMRDNVQQSGGVSFCITDELAMTLDSCVAALTARNQEMGDFVWLYFGAKYPALRIGRDHKMSEARARSIISTGVGWIDGRLENMRAAA